MPDNRPPDPHPTGDASPGGQPNPSRPDAAPAPAATAGPAAGTQIATVPSGTRAPAVGAGPAAGPQTGWGTPHVAPLHGPWPALSVWGRRWTGPAAPATPATLGAVFAAAAIAAVSVPLEVPGVGWLVTAIAGVAALVIAGRVPQRHRPGVPPPLVSRPAPTAARLTAARFAWSAATVALLGVGTVRAAGWLFVLCLFTAVLTGTLAVAGGRSVPAMLVAAAMGPVAVFRALPWVSRGLTSLHRHDAGRSSGPRAAATAGVSVALLLVFGGLFASADATFGRILARVVPTVDVGTVVRWCFVGGLTAAVLFGAAFLRAAPPQLADLEAPAAGRVRRLEWAVPLATLVLLFAGFVAVQITVLFAGGRHVLRTDGLTYAEYARGGFWQLLVVTGLTLLVLAGAARWAPRDTRADRTMIRVLLGALAGLTLVIVASALHRMDVYADTYGLTRLRVLVALCELWLGMVFLLIILAGVRLRAGWLPQAVVATGVLALLGLAAINPDAVIAERNLARYQGTGRIDLWYLSNLSADAVPALTRLPAAERDCVLSRIGAELAVQPDDWRDWNAARERARPLVPATTASCPPSGPQVWGR